MVTITKRGTAPKLEWPGKCPNCKCEFTFRTSEAKLISDQREGDYWSIDCPEKFCRSIVNIFARGN